MMEICSNQSAAHIRISKWIFVSCVFILSPIADKPGLSVGILLYTSFRHCSFCLLIFPPALINLVSKYGRYRRLSTTQTLHLNPELKERN